MCDSLLDLVREAAKRLHLEPPDLDPDVKARTKLRAYFEHMNVPLVLLLGA